ncbi:hypothetical protein CDL15_Pgr013517 [Punica granatum]|uniref:TF-B3 domain-containing protein n=1 Tax=Punica granatum TaxID=22663 RepID=A0A218W1W1_PUNGR|nr:hypothetical protein CDL15_Pgr013517 [Punica granatum]
MDYHMLHRGAGRTSEAASSRHVGCSGAKCKGKEKSSSLDRNKNIPAAFTRDHLNLESRKEMVTLMVGNWSWSTKLIISNPSLSGARFRGGFSAFAKENSLEAGDLCTFELIHRAKLVFRTSISTVKKGSKRLEKGEEV